MWISITPQLPVRDVAEAQRYYRDVLGFKIGWTAADESYGAVYIDANEVFFVRVDEPPARTVCCVRVSDVEAAYAERRDSGARIVSELETRSRGRCGSSPWRT